MSNDKKWEYHTWTAEGFGKSDLDALGKDRWELVAVIPEEVTSGFTVSVTFIFKRPYYEV